MITQYEFSLIHRFLMQNSMISHYFGIFEAMYHWEENDSTMTRHCVTILYTPFHLFSGYVNVNIVCRFIWCEEMMYAYCLYIEDKNVFHNWQHTDSAV